MLFCNQRHWNRMRILQNFPTQEQNFHIRISPMGRRILQRWPFPKSSIFTDSLVSHTLRKLQCSVCSQPVAKQTSVCLSGTERFIVCDLGPMCCSKNILRVCTLFVFKKRYLKQNSVFLILYITWLLEHFTFP